MRHFMGKSGPFCVFDNWEASRDIDSRSRTSPQGIPTIGKSGCARKDAPPTIMRSF